MSDNEQEGPEGQGQKVNVNMATLTFKRSEKMIKSFVFFDLETTDLIKGSKYPKITELAMVAISRDDLKVPQQKLPRILSKVVIPVCPNAEIPKIVTQITSKYFCFIYNLLSFQSLDPIGKLFFFYSKGFVCSIIFEAVCNFKVLRLWK